MDDLSESGDPEVLVEIETEGTAAVITVSGELDLTNGEQLDEAIEPLLASVVLETLIFDLSRLQFMDSSGIAVLLRAAAHGKAVRLRSPSPIVGEVLRATGLTEILGVEP